MAQPPDPRLRQIAVKFYAMMLMEGLDQLEVKFMWDEGHVKDVPHTVKIADGKLSFVREAYRPPGQQYAKPLKKLFEGPIDWLKGTTDTYEATDELDEDRFIARSN